MLLVNKRQGSGDAAAAISDYNGEVLGGSSGLIQKVIPYLTAHPSDPGKIQTMRNDLNPPAHDSDTVPTRQALREALGNLKRFRKNYLA